MIKDRTWAEEMDRAMEERPDLFQISNPQIESVHDHPVDGPVVIVHSQGPITDGLRRENPAHAFGPFPSEQAARDWNATIPEDTCFKTIIDLFDPK